MQTHNPVKQEDGIAGTNFQQFRCVRKPIYERIYSFISIHDILTFL